MKGLTLFWIKMDQQAGGGHAVAALRGLYGAFLPFCWTNAISGDVVAQVLDRRSHEDTLGEL